MLFPISEMQWTDRHGTHMRMRQLLIFATPSRSLYRKRATEVITFVFQVTPIVSMLQMSSSLLFLLRYKFTAVQLKSNRMVPNSKNL